MWLKLVLCFMVQSTRSESFSQSMVIYVCNPRILEAKAGGSQILAYPGKFSNLPRSCLKIRCKKGLGIQFSADALDSISSATHLKERKGGKGMEKKWKGRRKLFFKRIKFQRVKLLGFVGHIVSCNCIQYLLDLQSSASVMQSSHSQLMKKTDQTSRIQLLKLAF